LKNALAYCNAGVVAVHSKVEGLALGANPTIVSYNASTLKNLQRTFLETKILFPTLKKSARLLGTYNAGVVIVNSEVVGLDPGIVPPVGCQVF
jgi:hypothetical protein